MVDTPFFTLVATLVCMSRVLRACVLHAMCAACMGVASCAQVSGVGGGEDGAGDENGVTAVTAVTPSALAAAVKLATGPSILFFLTVDCRDRTWHVHMVPCGMCTWCPVACAHGALWHVHKVPCPVSP